MSVHIFFRIAFLHANNIFTLIISIATVLIFQFIEYIKIGMDAKDLSEEMN